MKKNLTVIFFANFFTLLSGVVTSLLTAWALGPEGRGDLALVVLYPNIVALAVGLGLPQAHRYFLAKNPEEISPLFSNALVFAAVMGALAYAAAELLVPSLIGNRSEAVMWMVKLYLINIPLALLYDLMAGMLEGTRQFKWAALSRIVFFRHSVGRLFFALVFRFFDRFLRRADNDRRSNSQHFDGDALRFARAASALAAELGDWEKIHRLRFEIPRRRRHFFYDFKARPIDARRDGDQPANRAYVIAVRLSEMTTVLASSVAEVLMPEVAASKEAERSTELLTRSLRQMIYVYLIILIPLIFGAPLILQYAFGAEFPPRPELCGFCSSPQ
jgi:O-antigen/teichoic acid export membrane protein